MTRDRRVRLNEHGQPVGDPVPGWTGRRRPAPVTLEGAHVTLEPLGLRHVDGILANLAPYPELWTYRRDEPPRDPHEARAMVGRVTHDVTFAVIRDGEVHGLTTLMRVDEAQGSVEVGGIIYSPGLQRTPASTEATYLLARHVFDELGYRRFEWKCDSLNAPSRAAALRLGFREEGTFRNALVYKGRNRDTTWFSITDAEWPGVRAALEAWLAGSNFDEAGAQRRSLADVRRGMVSP